MSTLLTIKYSANSTTEGLRGLEAQPALFAVGATPAYSNSAFDLLGLVVENITGGVPLEQTFNNSLVKSLGLTRTFYNTPSDSSIGAISVGETASNWNINLAFTNA